MAATKKSKLPYGTIRFKTIDEYHASVTNPVQKKLNQIRNAIKQAAPDAVETISYNIPTFKMNKNLVHYAAYEKHIGFYPTPGAIKFFHAELTNYTTSKGAVQFPHSQPLPLALIKKMVTYRVAEDAILIQSKKKLKQKPDNIHKDIIAYNEKQLDEDKLICSLLASVITGQLPEAENKIWHAHPVWFIDGNPVAGYSKMKTCIRLLFWSGQSFNEPGLLNEGSFKAAEKRYNSINQVNKSELKRWLKKCRTIQWDYKNIVKRKGVLIRLK